MSHLEGGRRGGGFKVRALLLRLDFFSGGRWTRQSLTRQSNWLDEWEEEGGGGIRRTGEEEEEEEARGGKRADIVITAADEVLMRSVLSGGGGRGGFLVEGALGFLLLPPRGGLVLCLRLLGDHSKPGRNVIPLTA